MQLGFNVSKLRQQLNKNIFKVSLIFFPWILSNLPPNHNVLVGALLWALLRIIKILFFLQFGFSIFHIFLNNVFSHSQVFCFRGLVLYQKSWDCEAEVSGLASIIVGKWVGGFLFVRIRIFGPCFRFVFMRKLRVFCAFFPFSGVFCISNTIWLMSFYKNYLDNSV